MLETLLCLEVYWSSETKLLATGDDGCHYGHCRAYI